MSGFNSTFIIGAVSTSAAIFAGIVFLAVFLRKKPLKKTLIDRATNVSLRLVDKAQLTGNTIKLTFALPSPEHVLGLPVGNHIYLKANINGVPVVRPYTPTSMNSKVGYVDLIIKVYKPNERFPKGGSMSQYVEQLKVGDDINVSGPAGRLEYKDHGLFHIKPDIKSPAVPTNVTNVNMIAGGTGITPMYQLIQYILNSSSDKTKLALVYANQTEQDIIVRDELLDLQEKHGDQFRVWFIVDRSTAKNWKYSIGFVDEKVLQEHAYAAGADTLTLVCGPPAMVEFACLPNLCKLSHTKEKIFIF